ncbi:MAG: hypothetical protein NZ529_10430 [Cytophagaceae bacterium]|nr:hypothetical protein [Cytophagaceae bacterium]MDW8457202.1 hypothetical protein [Cytophagaceae bacterium]
MKLDKIVIVLCLSVFLLSIASCSKKEYPCPGLGQLSEADVSMFDENGQLKTDSKKKKKSGPVRRINHDTGLVNKKKPKNITAPKKKHI